MTKKKLLTELEKAKEFKSKTFIKSLQFYLALELLGVIKKYHAYDRLVQNAPNRLDNIIKLID